MSGGKRFVLWGCLGCGALILLMLVVCVILGGLVGYRVYRFGLAVHESYREIAEGYLALEEQYPFVPPEDGVMREERLRAFLRVRGELARYVQAQMGKLVEAGKDIEKGFESPGLRAMIRGLSTIREMVSLATTLGAEVGKQHILQLGQEEMSASEYRWLTLTYLGTLAKAAQENVPGLAEMWKKYVEALEATRKDLEHVEIRTAKLNVRGKDLNEKRLMQVVSDAVYKVENARMVAGTAPDLLPDEDVGVLDYVALQLDELIAEFSKEAGDVSIHVGSGTEKSRLSP